MAGMAGQSRWGAAGWPRLAGAWGSRERALALGERFGGASGHSLSPLALILPFYRPRRTRTSQAYPYP